MSSVHKVIESIIHQATNRELLLMWKFGWKELFQSTKWPLKRRRNSRKLGRRGPQVEALIWLTLNEVTPRGLHACKYHNPVTGCVLKNAPYYRKFSPTPDQIILLKHYQMSIYQTAIVSSLASSNYNFDNKVNHGQFLIPNILNDFLNRTSQRYFFFISD